MPKKKITEVGSTIRKSSTKAGSHAEPQKNATGSKSSAKAASPAKSAVKPITASKKTVSAKSVASARTKSPAAGKATVTRKPASAAPVLKKSSTGTAASKAASTVKKVASKVTAKAVEVAQATARSAAKSVKAATAATRKASAGRTTDTVKKIAATTRTAERKAKAAAEDVVAKVRQAGKTSARTVPGKKATASPAAAAGSGNGENPVRPESEIVAPRPTDVKEHFFHEHRAHFTAAPVRELPYEYGETKIVLLARDPEWIYSYWEISDQTRQEFQIPRSGHGRRIVIRMYKVTGRDWPNQGAHYFFDVDVSPYANNWYLKVPETGENWCGELGVFDEHENYLVIARSGVITTPRDVVSDETDAEWMTVEETFRQLYGLSGTFTLQELRGSETLIRSIQKQILPNLRGEGYSSGSLFSSAARPTAAVEKDFWLQVHTELILYGATDPNADVTVQGRTVRLNPDGTFSLRFALPDGEQILRVRAVNGDGDMERVITPKVNKRTSEE